MACRQSGAPPRREQDPRVDARLAQQFAPGDWAGKQANADYVRNQFGLALSRGPLFGLVARLVHQKGIDLLTSVVPVENVLFASEMVGAVKGVDPETGHRFDDTRRYVDGATHLSAAQRQQIFEANARRVYGRLNKVQAARGLA